MKKVFYIAFILFLGFNTALYAVEGPQMGPREPLKNNHMVGDRLRIRLKEDLDLTDAQLDKIEKLREKIEIQKEKLNLDIEKINLDIKKEMLNDKIDFQKIKNLLKKINDIELQKKYLNIQFLEKAQKILNKDQFRKFVLLTERFKRALRRRLPRAH